MLVEVVGYVCSVYKEKQKQWLIQIDARCPENSVVQLSFT